MTSPDRLPSQSFSIPEPQPPASVAADAQGADLRASARIAIVDDEPINIKVARRYLQNVGYQQFITSTESATALDLIARERPDVVLLDVMMPRVNGIDILRAMRADAALQHVPVLILTASTDAETKLRALDAGATDFLAKPVDPNELIPRLRNALIVKAHHDHLARYSEQLEREVRLRTAELEASRLQVIHCLARAGEFRDDTTGHHVTRVSRYVQVLAAELGYSAADAAMLALAAQLHDVGKIGLPDAVLLKPGKLTTEEYAVVKRHAEIGFRIFDPAGDGSLPALTTDGAACSNVPLLDLAARIALTHHERWDGKGYPRALAGSAIPLEGRITSVADVFDALTSERPYKAALSPAESLRIMDEGRGTQFDPAVLDALHRRLHDILRIRREQADSSALARQAEGSPHTVRPLKRSA